MILVLKRKQQNQMLKMFRRILSNQLCGSLNVEILISFKDTFDKHKQTYLCQISDKNSKFQKKKTDKKIYIITID